MKKCPFCAEEIQDEAVKCRFCDSWVSGEKAGQSSQGNPLRPAVSGKVERRALYSGSPSWKAFFREYVVLALATVAVPVAAGWANLHFGSTTLLLAVSIAVPLAIGLFSVFIFNLYRRSKVFRVSTTNVENEHGLLTKKIDVIELWRCRDISYRQGFFDRILGIAHIDLFTEDVTSPNLHLLGLPASRHLFEQIREAIEIQRHAKNVIGIVD